MTFAGTAWATITSPAGSIYNGTLLASSSNFSFDGTVDVKCSHSTISGNVSKGSTTIVSSVYFTNCGNDTVAVQIPGSLSISSSDAVTLSGVEIAVQLHRTILGFLVRNISSATRAGRSSLTDRLTASN